MPATNGLRSSDDVAAEAHQVASESRRLVQSIHEQVIMLRTDSRELREAVEALMQADLARRLRDETYEKLAKTAIALFPVLVTLVGGLYWMIQHVHVR